MSARAATTNLCAPLTSFVGRAAELRALADLSGRSRLVSVLGPPGSGKTRLAIQHALGPARERATGGVWFCDLAEAAAADEIERCVARALDVPLTSGADGARTLGDALAARGPVLVVLDQFEEICEHAAATVGEWIRRAQEARFIVTSRQRLELPGEVVFDLGPLSLPTPGGDPFASEAVQLFIERARAVRAGYAPEAADAGVIGALIRALDGLPLLIELAAARMRALGAPQLLEDAERRAGALDAGGGPGERRATLRAVMDGSWTMLQEWERAALAQCSVFRGGFFIDAAEEVVDRGEAPGAPPVAEVLRGLRDRSLLALYEPPGLGGELRYTLLAGIREFAADRLAEAGGLKAAADRHARHYLRAYAVPGGQARGPASPAIRRRLDLDVDNLLAVHRRAVEAAPRTEAEARRVVESTFALDGLLGDRGPWALRLSLLDAAVLASSTPGVPAELRARSLTARSDAHRAAGRIEEAIDDCNEAASIGERLGDAAMKGRALCELAAAHCVKTRTAEARAAAEGALGAGAADRWVACRALQVLGFIDIAEDRLADARSHYEEALEIARDLGDRRMEGNLWNGLARMEQEGRKLPIARAHHEQALRIARETGNRRLEANSLGNIGSCCHAEGRFDEARVAYRAAATLNGEVGNRREEGLILACLGAVEAALGALDAALETFDAAEDRLRDVTEPAYLAACAVWRGFIDVALARQAEASGDAERAARHLATARLRCEEASRSRAGGASLVERSAAVRGAARMLEAAVAAAGAPAKASPRVVASSGSWFMAQGEKVRLHRRRALRDLLRALIEHRIKAPGEALSVRALAQRGWPEEKLRAGPATNRVHNALSTLRSMGFRGVLLRREDGYLFDPVVPITICEDTGDDPG